MNYPPQYSAAYSAGFQLEDISRARSLCEQKLGEVPRGFWPSEKVFCISDSWVIANQGFQYAVIGAEHFGENAHARWHKGQVFQLSNGLYVIPTVNEIQPQRYSHAEDLIDAVIRFARENSIGRVLISCDIDEYLDDGGADRLIWIHRKALERADEISVTFFLPAVFRFC
jgi:hypothetical protein